MSSKEVKICYVCVGRLIDANGEVLLKRQGEAKFQKAEVGEQLYFGDLLKPAPGVRVRVQCADGKTIWTVPAGEISGAGNGCPPPSIPISTDTGRIISPLK